MVSAGELMRARRAGISPSAIVFSGVGKTRDEIALALAEEVGQINVESAAELAMISAVAASLGRTASVALRINPDVDAGTHAKITTGKAENKFGIPYAEVPELYAHAARLPGIVPVGIALHIGSQILRSARTAPPTPAPPNWCAHLRAAGQKITRVDCGGGLGIGYRDLPGASPTAFAGALRAAFAGLDVELMIEPGRWLVGPAGVLLSTVVLTKADEKFLVIDAAMNDLVRPAMYDAWHAIVPLAAGNAVGAGAPVDVVGPVCESGDTFARARSLPALAADDRVAILDVGAYGAVMSSTYNARPLAPIALVDGSRWAVIRPRQTLDEMWNAERVPDFLNGSRAE